MLGLFWVLVGGGRFILGDDKWRGVILGFGEWWWVVVDIFWVVVSGGGFILGGGGCWWLVERFIIARVENIFSSGKLNMLCVPMCTEVYTNTVITNILIIIVADNQNRIHMKWKLWSS